MKVYFDISFFKSIFNKNCIIHEDIKSFLVRIIFYSVKYEEQYCPMALQKYVLTTFGQVFCLKKLIPLKKVFTDLKFSHLHYMTYFTSSGI